MLVKREATALAAAVRVAAPTLHVANNKYEGARTRETTRRGESECTTLALSLARSDNIYSILLCGAHSRAATVKSAN
jgi:hypothetical protein